MRRGRPSNIGLVPLSSFLINMQIILTENEYNELKSQSCKDAYETNKQIYLLERKIDELKRENDRLARENCELLLNNCKGVSVKVEQAKSSKRGGFNF